MAAAFPSASPSASPAVRAALAAMRRRPLPSALADEAAAALHSQGPLLPVVLRPPCPPSRPPATCPAPVRGMALVDTGAHTSFVSTQAAERLGLLRAGEMEVAGVTGVETYPTYVTDLTFAGEARALPRTVGVMGSSPTIRRQGFDVLFGRDALRSMGTRFFYDGGRGEFGLAPGDEAAAVVRVRPVAAVRLAPVLAGAVLGATVVLAAWAWSAASPPAAAGVAGGKAA